MRSSIVSVVAGGWSVSQVDQTQIPGTIIAINDACVYLPRYDVALSMDRLWTEHRFDFLRKKRLTAWIRRSAMQNLSSERWPWLHIFDCDYASSIFSDSPHVLNGTHSGLCGLNLAYALRPNRLFLFGFDMQGGPKGETHWYPPYAWAPNGATSKGKYNAWANQFAAARRAFDAIGTEVFNVSPRSTISAFKKIRPAAIPDMTCAA